MTYPSAAALYLSHFVSPISVLNPSEKNSSSVNPNVRTGFRATVERMSAIWRGVIMVEQTWMMLSIENEVIKMLAEKKSLIDSPLNFLWFKNAALTHNPNCSTAYPGKLVSSGNGTRNNHSSPSSSVTLDACSPSFRDTLLSNSFAGLSFLDLAGSSEVGTLLNKSRVISLENFQPG